MAQHKAMVGGMRPGQLIWNAWSGNAKVRPATVYQWLTLISLSSRLHPPPSHVKDKKAGVATFILGSYKKEKLI